MEETHSEREPIAGGDIRTTVKKFSPSLRRPDLSVQNRLTWIYRFLTAGLLIATWAAGLVYEFHQDRERIKLTLQSEAAVLKTHAKTAIVFSDSSAARETLNSALFPNPVQWAAIKTVDGRLISTYGNAPTASELQSQFGNGTCALESGFSTIRLCEAINYDDKRVGYLLLGTNLTQTNQRFLITAVAGFLFFVLLIVLSNAIFRRMSRSITDPIKALIKVSRHVSETGNFKQRVAVVNQDEIGELSRDFNSMLASLEDRDNSLRAELEERLRIQAQLDNLAHFDAITGLPNRHYFSSRLQLAIEQAEYLKDSVGLLFIDLDNFKFVNDSLGHKAGDHLLAELGKRFKALMREGDVIARFGGDEFAVIVEKSTSSKLQRTAEKITESLAEPVYLEGHEIFTTVSVGIAVYPEDASDQQLLVSHADVAMYSAKTHGKGRYAFYSREMSLESARRLENEGQLRHAVIAGQFELYYQPVIDAASKAIVGAEALIRWNHPERGIVLPWEFIPLAEENGLIVPIGDAVLEQACCQIRLWEQAGIDVPQIAINVSGRQIEEATFVSRVLACIKKTGCNPSSLSIELTESTLMTRHEQILAKLHQLRQAGLTIAIDDFGTGYSSMAYLKTFPVNRLKIDRSFVRDILSDAQDRAITQAMIALGHGLDMQIVAEGVENEEQAILLSNLGCTSLQGYFYSHPLPASEFAAFCRFHEASPARKRAQLVRV